MENTLEFNDTSIVDNVIKEKQLELDATLDAFEQNLLNASGFSPVPPANVGPQYLSEWQNFLAQKQKDLLDREHDAVSVRAQTTNQQTNTKLLRDIVTALRNGKEQPKLQKLAFREQLLVEKEKAMAVRLKQAKNKLHALQETVTDLVARKNALEKDVQSRTLAVEEKERALAKKELTLQSLEEAALLKQQRLENEKKVVEKKAVETTTTEKKFAEREEKLTQLEQSLQVQNKELAQKLDLLVIERKRTEETDAARRIALAKQQETLCDQEKRVVAKEEELHRREETLCRLEEGSFAKRRIAELERKLASSLPKELVELKEQELADQIAETEQTKTALLALAKKKNADKSGASLSGEDFLQDLWAEKKKYFEAWEAALQKEAAELRAEREKLVVAQEGLRADKAKERIRNGFSDVRKVSRRSRVLSNKCRTELGSVLGKLETARKTLSNLLSVSVLKHQQTLNRKVLAIFRGFTVAKKPVTGEEDLVKDFVCSFWTSKVLAQEIALDNKAVFEVVCGNGLANKAVLLSLFTEVLGFAKRTLWNSAAFISPKFANARSSAVRENTEFANRLVVQNKELLRKYSSKDVNRLSETVLNELVKEMLYKVGTCVEAQESIARFFEKIN